MTVLVVPSWYKSGGQAQLGAFFREQALALNGRGVCAIVADATLQSRQSALHDQFRLRVLNDEGLLTYAYTTPSFGGWRLPRLGVRIYYSNLKKIMKHLNKDGKRIDVIHAHSYFPAGVAAVRLGKKLHIPVVITEHSGSIISGKLSKTQQTLLAECVEKADSFICVSEALGRQVIAYTGTENKIEVIPNMVSPLFVPETKEHDSCFTFISVGNLVKSKRFDLTLRAFSKSFQGDTRFRLKIVGDGIERSSLKEMALDLGIDGQVVFTGRLSRAEVLKQLQESDAFVLPSDFETFGVAYIEALACGLPVIGTHNGGADEIINDGCGYLVDTGDDTQLAEAMLRLYREYQYYDKVRLANDCQARFGEEIVCERIIDVYNGYKD